MNEEEIKSHIKNLLDNSSFLIYADANYTQLTCLICEAVTTKKLGAGQVKAYFPHKNTCSIFVLKKFCENQGA